MAAKVSEGSRANKERYCPASRKDIEIEQNNDKTYQFLGANFIDRKAGVYLLELEDNPSPGVKFCAKL